MWKIKDVVRGDVREFAYSRFLPVLVPVPGGYELRFRDPDDPEHEFVVFEIVQEE